MYIGNVRSLGSMMTSFLTILWKNAFFFLLQTNQKITIFFSCQRKKKPIRVYNDSSCNQKFPLISKHFNIFQFFFFLIMKSMHSMTTVTSIPDTFLLVSFKDNQTLCRNQECTIFTSFAQQDAEIADNI